MNIVHSIYLWISELWESVNDDTKDDVQSNGGNEDEEGYIKECDTNCNAKIVCQLFLKLLQKKAE